MKEIIKQLKYDDKGLIPAITQDYKTDEVLMMAYMNAESLEKTLDTGRAHYFSRSRQKLWLKGETSGHFQNVKSISIDCDADTLLLKVEQIGAACHTGERSCFHRKMEIEAADIKVQKIEEKTETEALLEVADHIGSLPGPEVLQAVFDVIIDRKIHPKEGSYTNYLLDKGMDKILKKVGEETSEVIIAAKNGIPEDIKLEVADLLYHIMVMLVKQGMTLEDIYSELQKRQ